MSTFHGAADPAVTAADAVNPTWRVTFTDNWTGEPFIWELSAANRAAAIAKASSLAGAADLGQPAPTLNFASCKPLPEERPWEESPYRLSLMQRALARSDEALCGHRDRYLG